MKLKFRPSVDNNREPSQSDNEFGKPAPVEESSSAGKGMLFIAFILLIGLLTVYFQSQIDERHNPNQSIVSSQNDQGEVIVGLKRNRSGHYVANGEINGHTVTFLLDTGATDVAIPMSMQNALGLRKGHPMRISTANGISRGYQTIISDLSLGPIYLQNVKAILTPNLEHILLGMSALKQLEFTQRGNMLYLKLNPLNPPS